MMKQIGKFKIHWLLLGILLILFLASTFIGDVFHPWDEYMEKSNIGILNFDQAFGGNVDPDKLTEESFSDRMELMKYNIYQLLFAKSSNNILHAVARKLLSPIEDFAKSISLAIGYSDIFGNNVQHFLIGVITIVVYFLLFYGFQFGKNKLLDRLNIRDEEINRDSKAGKWVVRGQNWLINYCVEGISAFLFLLTSFGFTWGFNQLMTADFGQGGGLSFLSKSRIFEIFVYLFIIALLAFFVLLLIALFICVAPYYILMALPVMFVAWLPLWVWMPLKMIVCLLMEVFVIGFLFPKLAGYLNLWNIVKGLLHAVGAVLRFLWNIPRFIFWPIRKLLGRD